MSNKKQKSFDRDVKRLKTMTLQALEAVYTRAAKIAKSYGTEYITFGMFKMVIQKSKLGSNELAKEEIALFNKALSAFQEDLEDISTNQNSTNIPLVNVREGVDICKQLYEEHFDNYKLKE
jgi:hypothetical protein